ncbi:zinc finger A20 and AN1 domain-containing stress-associated protein [Musa troglodytarum]|uniref:Zinc finger A20 and AN1 domain-containing stress-associated protein n=1 Tax=Musa troglodytarum TaxID=320322 RepID=A0A9E7KPA2_9LILI|nr:zinc finger A20 and AN1 domain-containing stress-associated protein [Musa troglodytarum]
MARKRKTEAMRLDEVDRTLYSTFCSAANSLSQLYTQAMNQQKISFQAGERHAMEKLYQWIVRKHEEGSRVSVSDIVTHIQNVMDYTGEDALVSPRSSFPHQHQTPMHATNSSVQPPSALFGQPTVGLTTRSGHSDQTKNSVFSNALSSPVRRSLQPYHLAQGGGFYVNGVVPAGNTGSRNLDANQNRETNSLSFSDSSMDIHTDSPPHESY